MQEFFSVADIDSRKLRTLLGQYATGVTVVTTVDDTGHKIGMTANSFSSVSLNPPLILWSIAKTSSNAQTFCNAKNFAINILAEQQHQASNHFAKSASDKFSEFDAVSELHGVPVLTEALTSFICKTHNIVEAGDHFIILGEIEQCQHNGGKPLVFLNGQYHQAQLHPVYLEHCA